VAGGRGGGGGAGWWNWRPACRRRPRPHPAARWSSSACHPAWTSRPVSGGPRRAGGALGPPGGRRCRRLAMRPAFCRVVSFWRGGRTTLCVSLMRGDGRWVKRHSTCVEVGGASLRWRTGVSLSLRKKNEERRRTVQRSIRRGSKRSERRVSLSTPARVPPPPHRTHTPSASKLAPSQSLGYPAVPRLTSNTGSTCRRPRTGRPALPCLRPPAAGPPRRPRRPPCRQGATTRAAALVGLTQVAPPRTQAPRAGTSPGGPRPRPRTLAAPPTASVRARPWPLLPPLPPPRPPPSRPPWLPTRPS